MSLRVAPLLLLLIALLLWGATSPTPPASAAPVPKSLKGKVSTPDGTWKLTEFWSSGQKGNAQGMTPVWVLEGEAFYVGQKAENNYWQLTIPDPAKPNVRRFAHGRTNTTAYPAMVEVDGDTLKFCYAFSGTEDLTECAPTKNVHYYVFTRLKADDPPASPPK